MFLSPLESEHMSPVCPVGNLSKSQPPGAAIVNIITQLPAPVAAQLTCPLSSLQLYQGPGWQLLFTASALVTLCLYNQCHHYPSYPTIIIWKISPSWVLISTYFLETWAKCQSCVLDVLYFGISASFCAVSCNFSHTWYSFVSGDMRRYRTGRCYKSCWPGLGWEIMNGGRGKHFKMAENIFWLQEIKKIQSRH